MIAFRVLGLFVTLLVVSTLNAAPANASHRWGPYHWARTSTAPLSLTILDSVVTKWNDELTLANTDWNKSVVLDDSVVASSTTASVRSACAPVSGKIRACNYTYGATGWIGLASIGIDANDHIVQGTAKVNDSYSMSAATRQLVMCQEVGHDFGLVHQDENFTNPNLNTCMDYTNTPASNQHPNTHDYRMLKTIYNHTDAAASGRAQSTRTSSVIRAGGTVTRIVWAR